MKQIVLINHSDTRGGAAVVTYRLMEALCRCGVDARMVVMHKYSNNPRVDAVGDSLRARMSFLAEHAEIYARDGLNRDNVFKISTARYGLPLHRHPWVRQADAVCLNWVNQGMLSIDGLRRICSMGKPVAWTMHDMWCMTGVCHHAGTCQRFRTVCGNCPLLGSGAGARDLSTAVFNSKKKLYADTDIRFVAVSNWLADKCRESSLLHDANVSVIPNAFPVSDFGPLPEFSRRDLGLPEGVPLVVMGAARLDDPVKNLPLAVESLNYLARMELNPQPTVVFFGDIRDAHALDTLALPHILLGPVSDRRRLASIYAHADAVLSTSLYETLPGTLIEGIASGAMAVATGRGGQADIITPGVTGFIDPGEDNPRRLAEYLSRAIRMQQAEGVTRRRNLHAEMARRFEADAVARRYISLLFGDEA